MGVSEADWRRKCARPRNSLDPPGASGSERSAAGRAEGGGGGGSCDNSLAVRAKSVRHGKREGAQSCRLRRDDTSTVATTGRNLDDAPQTTTPKSPHRPAVGTLSLRLRRPTLSSRSTSRVSSVQTTSTKPPLDIRGDTVRVLEQLGVSYKEIKDGFCVHRSSIDLKSVTEDGGQSAEAADMVFPSPASPQALVRDN